MIKTDCFILLVWTFRATTLILGQHKYTQPSFLYLVQHQTKTRCVWDVLKCFHPVRVSNRRSLHWLRQIHKWEVVNLTRRGTCERILPSGPWQTTLEETLVDMGVAVMHTLKWGDGHFCLPSRLQKKRTIRSSSRCLFGFSPTHIHATLKVTQHCCFLTGGEALICTRQREILAAEINVYFSAVSISNCSLFPSLLRKHPKGDVRLPKQKHCQTKPAASYGSSQACQKKKKKKKKHPVRCRISVYRWERAEDIFFTHMIQYVGIRTVSSRRNQTSSSRPIGLWSALHATCSAFSDYFKAQREVAFKHKTRKGRLHIFKVWFMKQKRCIRTTNTSEVHIMERAANSCYLHSF